MNIISQLEFELDFTNSEKEIAHYILKHGKKILSMNVKELAKATFSSPATIVRLTQKLGLNGYNDFKIQYSAELEAKFNNLHSIDANFPFQKQDSLEEVASKLAKMQEETIENTRQLLDFDLLNTISYMIDKAASIDLYGTGNCSLSALSFQHKMTRIFKNVNIRLIEGEQIFFAKSSNSTHIALLLSYSGETSELLRIAKVLKQTQTPMIIITSIGDNKLSKYSQYVLRVDSREKIFNKIAPISSFISMNYVLDLIYCFILKLNYNELIDEKVAFDKDIDQRHPLSSPINDFES